MKKKPSTGSESDWTSQSGLKLTQSVYPVWISKIWILSKSCTAHYELSICILDTNLIFSQNFLPSIPNQGKLGEQNHKGIALYMELVGAGPFSRPTL